MIRAVLNFFRADRKHMVGSLHWTITWTDVGCKESGYFQLFETESGRRSFSITNKAMLTSTKEHPGYGSCRMWANGGAFPSNAVRLYKGEVVQ